MFAQALLGLLAVVELVRADTGPGFPFQVAQSLNVSFGSNNVSPAGELIPRPETADPPSISTPIFTSAGRAVLFMVDSDVPRNGTRVQLLHWLASNVTLSPTDNRTLSVPGTPEAAYRQPSPPVGDTSHAYTFILFPQPEGFSIPSQFQDVLESRVFFNISGFVQAAGLGDALAGNYIRVQNLTGSATTTFPPPRATNATTSGAVPSATGPAQFPGEAVGGFGGGRAFWVGVGAAVVAGVAAVAL
ncbi:PEBP-like protein [Polyplosphaeria fusca]|uniref:PEBP-like protein n=1 Tax=Polyplosphaeria fusca TaxID=682080 RepID=A0A9P4QPD0_9PLEO|nr:PEBP-like protein [Polyplosphaeria fusca]